MTDAETPPRPRPRRIHAALVVACAATACSVALHPTGAPTRPAATPTATRTVLPLATVTPVPPASPIPRLAHLEVPPDVAAEAESATAAAPTAEPALPRAAGAGTVALERRGDLLVAPARIAERAIGDLLLDTGAGATFLDQALADELRLTEIYTASTKDTPGEASIRELRGLTVGDLALATERTFVVDLAGADTLVGGRLAGVIGFPALGSAPFTLDFTTATLTRYADAAFEPPASVPDEALRVDQGLPFVETTLADGTTVWLLLDTGSSAALTVWRGFAKQHPDVVRRAPQPAAGGTAASGAPDLELRALRLLGEQHERIPVLVQDAPTRPWQRARVVGRVGMALLRDLRITVHPATERIWVERPPRAGNRE